MAQARPLSQHLAELRQRLLWVVGLYMALFIGLYVLREPYLDLLLTPLLAAGATQVIAIGVLEPFVVQLKLAAYGALLLLSPFLLGQLWAFVAPGLYRQERQAIRWVVWLLPLAFGAGVLFCWLVVLPPALAFMLKLAGDNLTPLPAAGLYLTLVVRMLLAFGLVFQLPLLLWSLVRLEVLSVAQLAAMRRYVVVLAVAVGALLTPPDPLTQLMLALPVWIFYELTLFFLQRQAGPERGDLVESAAQQKERTDD
jgi:sec-independent protein translocase protein TatC